MQKSEIIQPWTSAREYPLSEMRAVSAPRLKGAKRAVAEWLTVQEYEKVLDLSCDDGALLCWLKAKYRLTACGISESAEQAHFARERLSDADILAARPVDIPWHDAAFDTVFSAAPAGNYQDFERVLAEVRRVLRKGGQFVLSVPRLSSDGNAPRVMMRQLQQAGFQNVSWRPFRLSGVCVAWKDPELS